MSEEVQEDCLEEACPALGLKALGDGEGPCGPEVL